MNDSLQNKSSSSHLIHKSKFLTYFFIAFLMSLVQALEDVADKDDMPIEILGKSLLIMVLMSIIFPLFSMSFRLAKKKWNELEVIAYWKYKDIIFVLIYTLGLPILLTLFAFTFRTIKQPEDIWTFGVITLIAVSIIVVVESFWLMLDKKQQLELTNERLLRNQEMAKYQALMNQLNPHFLFNSLNVLSYLVYQDQRGAEQFIEELSKIYRYIIQLNETFLVSLRKEIDFISSYMYLQKIRHQDNLTYEIEIPLESYKKFIPPLTLEVLVENAIKHNIIADGKPLHIRLFLQNEQLIVQNNVQLRNENEIQSTHVGLKNLLEKFQILESKMPEFFIKNDQFIAKIPLIESNL